MLQMVVCWFVFKSRHKKAAYNQRNKRPVEWHRLLTFYPGINDIHAEWSRVQQLVCKYFSPSLRGLISKSDTNTQSRHLKMKLKPRVSFKPADQSPSIKQEKKSVSPNHWPSNRANLHESRIFLASRLAQNEFDELFSRALPRLRRRAADRSFVKNTPDPAI